MIPQPLKLSDNGRHFIEGWEGLFLHTYNDGTGVLTIGYGHTSAAGLPRVHPGMIITKDQADQILATDLQSVVNDVNRFVDVQLNQNQFDALTSFHFNTGALDRSSALRDVNSKRFDLVPAALLLWCHGGGRFLQGLYNRRQAEGKLFAALPPQ